MSRPTIQAPGEPIPGSGPQLRGPLRERRGATVRGVHLGDVLFLFSSLMLLGAGLENLGLIQYKAPWPYIALGTVAILVGVLFLTMVVRPGPQQGLGTMLDMIAISLSLVMLIWGLAAVFLADQLGWSGGFITAGALASMVACLLRLGMIR